MKFLFFFVMTLENRGGMWGVLGREAHGTRARRTRTPKHEVNNRTSGFPGVFSGFLRFSFVFSGFSFVFFCFLRVFFCFLWVFFCFLLFKTIRKL